MYVVLCVDPWSTWTCALYRKIRMTWFAFLYIPPIEWAPYLENAVFFPLDDFRSFIKDQVTRGVWDHYWDFNSVPLLYLPVSLPISHRFYQYCSVMRCEVIEGGSLRCSFIVKKSFLYPCFFFFLFQTKLQITLSNSLVTSIGFYMEITSNLWIDFSTVAFFYYTNPANP